MKCLEWRFVSVVIGMGMEGVRGSLCVKMKGRVRCWCGGSSLLLSGWGREGVMGSCI